MATSILGTPDNDTLSGTAGVADVISGLDGNDDLSSGEVSASAPGDTLDGGNGNDVLTGGNAVDVLIGGAGNDLLLSSQDGADTLDGGEGNDQLFAGSGATLRGGLGNDALYARNNALLDGGAGNDGIRADGNNDTVLGGEGNDFIFSLGSGNLLDGGSGNDQIITTFSTNDTLIGGAGVDTLSADLSGNRFRITADTGLDIITVTDTTGSVAGTIEMPAGVTAAAITQQMEGRNLRLSWGNGANAVLIVNYVTQELITTRPFIILLSNGQQLSTTAAVNTVRTAGTDGNDGLIGDDLGNNIFGAAGQDTIRGQGGNDLIEGQLGSDLLFGGSGADTLRGGWNDDVIYGDADNDVIDGNYGNDALYGGDGNDTLNGGSGDDYLDSGTGTNVLTGGAGNDTLVGGTGARNTYNGGEGDDLISVDAGIGGTIVMGLRTGNDTVNLNQVLTTGTTPSTTLQLEAGLTAANVGIQFLPGQERVYVIGGNSSTTFNVGTSRLDQITLADGTSWNRATITQRALLTTAGDDVVYSTATNAALSGGTGNDSLYGLGGNTLDGGAGDDFLSLEPAGANAATLIGGSGKDTLVGNDGADTLTGGTGDDLLRGGIGKDTYNFNIGDGNDIVLDDDWLLLADRTSINAGLQVRLGAGMTKTNIVLRRVDDNLVIQSGSGQDQWELNNYYAALPTTTFLFFSDGTSMTNTEIQSRATLASAIAADVLGTAGNDSLSAGYSITDNTISGLAGNDTLDAGTFNGTLIGGAGNDTYQWGLNGGNVTIVDALDAGATTSGDVLVLGAGITTSMVTLTPSSGVLSNKLGWVLSIAGKAGSVSVVGSAATTPIAGQPSLRFADGTVWNQATILDKLRRADPIAYNWSLGGADTLSAGYGLYKTAYGGAGADTYIVDRSNAIQAITPATTAYNEHPALAQEFPGHSTLYDGSPAPAATDVDTLKLVGIRPQDLTARVLPGYNTTVQLGLRDTDFQLTLEAWLANSSTAVSEVDRVVFDDGTVWGRAELTELASKASDNGLNLLGGLGNDSITGEDGNDWLGGGAGRDTLVGGAGRDTLAGGADNDTYIVTNSDDVIIELANEGKDVIQSSVDYTVPDNVESIVLTGSADLRATGRVTMGTGMVGNIGNNVLTGGSVRDTLSGGFGVDTLIGGEGGDYYYVIDDVDVIVEAAGGDDIDVIFSLSENVVMGSNVEYLFMKTDGTLSGIGSAEENWMYGNAIGNILEGRGGDDHIFCKSGQDTLIGGLGSDELNGGTGNDLYIFARGDGADTLTDRDTLAGNTDVLRFDNLSRDQLWLSQSNDDLIVQVLGSSDSVSITNWYLGTANQIERLTVGTQTLSNDRVAALVQVMSTMVTPATSVSNLSAPDQAKLQTALNAAWQG